jgi:hypothetical protein
LPGLICPQRSSVNHLGIKIARAVLYEHEALQKIAAHQPDDTLDPFIASSLCQRYPCIVNAALALAESIAFLFATPQGAGLSCRTDANGVIQCSDGISYRRDSNGVLRDSRGNSWTRDANGVLRGSDGSSYRTDANGVLRDNRSHSFWYDANGVLRSSHGVSCSDDANGVTRCY